MINFIVVNCYTKSHEQAALRLIESLKKFYPENYYTEMYSSRGHWLKNCLYKSVFIKEQLIKFKKPVLWLDADSVILKKLTVIENFDTSIDVGMYFLDKVTPTRIKKLATTNTVYLNYNDKVLFEKKLKITPNAKDLYERNRMIIDFNYIPEQYVNNVTEIIKNI